MRKLPEYRAHYEPFAHGGERRLHHKRTHTPQWRIIGRLLIDLVKLIVWKANKLLGGY